MNPIEIVVPRASWSDVLLDDAEEAFIMGVPRSRKSRKRPVVVHLQNLSFLSKEWGEVHLTEVGSTVEK